jgi:hypothetical protein
MRIRRAAREVPPARHPPVQISRKPRGVVSLRELSENAHLAESSPADVAALEKSARASSGQPTQRRATCRRSWRSAWSRISRESASVCRSIHDALATPPVALLGRWTDPQRGAASPDRVGAPHPGHDSAAARSGDPL